MLSISLVAFGLLGASPRCRAAQGKAASEMVPVLNPGFEALTPAGGPLGWQCDPKVYDVDSSVAHSGQSSLRWHNEDPSVYTHCSQNLPLKPGRMYEFSAWVKTKGLKGPGSGATICLEWSDAAGNYLGGSYPSGVKGNTNWTLIKGISARLPDNAASCHMLCYVRPKMVGTAWFDDVVVKRAFADPLQSFMLTHPNYRGWLWAGKPRIVDGLAQVDKSDLGCAWSDLRLRMVVKSGSGNAVGSTTATPGGDATHLRLTLPDTLAAGTYGVSVSLLDRRSGKTLGTRTSSVVILPKGVRPKVYVDEYNRLIVDGKPFFPLGCYWTVGDMKDSLLRLYADSPFNCLMPYGEPTREQMALAHKYGLWVIYSIKDSYYGSTWCPPAIKSKADEKPWIEGVIRKFRDSPALLGWYLNDELGLEYLPRLTAHHRWAEQTDPNHPDWIVIYQVSQVRQYVPTFDAIGTDPYPIPNPPRMAGDWAHETEEGVAHARPVWMVPQIMSHKAYDPKGNGRTPTLAEMRSMAWQCICEGAKGLVFYSFFDIRRDPQTPFDVQWARVKQMADEIRKWEPLLLSVDKPVKVVASGLGLRSIAKAAGGTTYVFVVNDGYNPEQVSFRVPKGMTVRRLSDSALLHEAKGKGPVDTLKGLDMQVYEVEPKG